MEIGDRQVGSQHPTYVIAEAGVNHNGDFDRALEMVSAAAQAGADALKFQLFSPDRLVTSDTVKVQYQQGASGEEESQWAMLERLKLGVKAHQRLMERGAHEGITVLSTPFDPNSATALAELGVPVVKIGSGDLTNRPLLEHVASLDRPMIVSTGMASLAEVRRTHAWITAENPDIDLALLHCTSVYPTALGDVNLAAMESLADEFSVPVGHSDHTRNVHTPAWAVAAGASIVEKHFTLDRDLPGPDQEASLEPAELARAISLARDAWTARGDPEKRPVSAEAEMREQARRSLHATSPISVGEAFDAENVGVRRPNTGLEPAAYDTIIGSVASEELSQGDPITASAVAGDVIEKSTGGVDG